MKALSQFSPAETLLILHPSNSRLGELARATFFDLLLRNILKLEMRYTDPEAEDETEMPDPKPFISIGEHFHEYTPKKHEAVFLAPFDPDDERIISMENLIKIAFASIASSEAYKNRYIKNEELAPYISSSSLNRLFGVQRLSKEGKALRKEIQAYLDTVEEEIDQEGDYDDKLLSKIMKMNGNIVLIGSINSATFAQLFKAKEKKHKKLKEEGDYDEWDASWYDYGVMFYAFDYGTDVDLFEDSFDGVFDVFDSLEGFGGFNSLDSDSVDVGGTGCGGCSGCGGCGGCGG